MENEWENSGLSGKEKALAFMRSKKPRILFRKPAPEAKPAIGKLIEGEGVYIGKWKPKDRDGNSLGKTFNVFAAPKDITDEQENKVLLQFNEAVLRVAELKNWHGHDGGNYKNDTAIYNALKEGSYNGEWFIPTFDVLHGNLYARKNKGAMKGTFTTKDDSPLPNFPNIYWSSTEFRGYPSSVHVVRFSDGGQGWDLIKDGPRLSCRPVRLAAAAPTPALR